MNPKAPTQAPVAITLTATPIRTSPDSSGAADTNIYQITLHIALEPEDWIYHDYITLSCDAPDISLSPWQATQEPVARYINNFKETKLIYASPFSITSIATISTQKTSVNNASQTQGALGNLHLTYYRKSDKKITHHLVPFNLSNQEVFAEQSRQSLDKFPQYNYYATTRRKPEPSHKAIEGTAGEAQSEGGDERAEENSQSSLALSGTALVQMGDASPVSCNTDTKTGSSQNSLTPESPLEHNTQAQANHAPDNKEAQGSAPTTHYLSRAHALFSDTRHHVSLSTKQYRAEVHTLIIIMLIAIFSMLKQKRRIACAAQNIGLCILLWCYYAVAGMPIPDHCYWLLTAILVLCVGILGIKKAEDISPARFSKRVYRYLYSFLIIAGMVTVASSPILCAKAAQAYYMYYFQAIAQIHKNAL